MNTEILRRPSAFVPPLMSLAALAVVGIHLARYGVTHEADEGTSAHLWQILMAAQLPLGGYFLLKWLRADPRGAWPVVALQIGAALLACASVYLLHL